MRAARDHRLRQINARFQAATPRRYSRRSQPSIPTLLKGVTAASLAGLLAVLSYSYLTNPAMQAMTPKNRLRHLLAVPNCSAARLVGVAPARTGEPGYWTGHDADRDGVACEPFPRRRF